MKRALNWILAFLLTGALSMLGVSWAFRQAIAPELKNGGTPVSDEIRTQEMEMIRGKVDELASIYGFDAEWVMRMVTPETLKDLNDQSAVWWNRLLTEGVSSEEPQWDTESVREQLTMDETFIGEDDAETADRKIMQAESAIHQAVIRTVLPMRVNLMALVMMEAGKRVDIPNLIRFCTGIPAALLAACFLLAGLIGLTECRKLAGCLKYLGSALAGGAIVTACALILGRRLPVSGIVGEASPSLLLQYGALSSGMTIRLAAFSALLLTGGILCLLAWRRSTAGKKAKQA